MDQSGRKVTMFKVEMEFDDGTTKTVIMKPTCSQKGEHEHWMNGKAYYRETESHIMGDNGRRESLYVEHQLVWSKKTPWVEPEKRG